MRIHLLRDPLFKERYIRRNRDMALYAHHVKNLIGGAAR